MVKCIDCEKESDDSKGWFADFSQEGKIMRCNLCGEKEKEKRWKIRYGDRNLPEEVNKNEVIQHTKDLRDADLSPWKYRKE